VCCQVGVSATEPALVQRSPTECGVSECGLRTSRRTPRLTGAVDNEDKQASFVCNIL